MSAADLEETVRKLRHDARKYLTPAEQWRLASMMCSEAYMLERELSK